MDPLIILLGVFLFVLGTCIGSFLNVVIWRLPYKELGAIVTYGGKTDRLTLSWPPSHCPNCDAGIPWYLNLPVLGWLMIAGRCANCRKPIAVRYPLVELATGVLFLAVFLGYLTGLRHGFELQRDWPAMLLHLVFVAAFLAAAAIDADSYIIPISIPALVSVVAVVSAPFINSPLIPHIPDDLWAHWSNPVLGAAIGLLLANILVYLRVIPLSFAVLDVDSPEGKKAAEEAEKQRQEEVQRVAQEGVKESAEVPADAPPAAPAEDMQKILPLPVITRKLPVVLSTILSLFAAAMAWITLPATWAALVTLVAGTVIFLVGVLSRDADTPDATEEVMEEISAKGARREILKEILFLLFPIVGAVIGAVIPMTLPESPWLARLLGVIAGLLVGGGVIWFVRVLGTLWKGIQAMGLGDVHLMAAAGAILGPGYLVVAFPALSSFLALAYAGVRYLTHRRTILPFGPWLAIASIIALVVGESAVRWYVTNFL